MKIERTKNATKNIVFGAGLKLYQMVLPFLMRTAMIHFMGVQYLGLSSLFTSVLHILNLAELGVGSAMVFSMYEPIARDDHATICALMGLYRRYYRIIGLVIGVVGLTLTPFIPRLISGDVPAELNIYVLYLMNLGSTVLTYWLFAYKNCLLQAYQRTDVVSKVTALANTLQYVLQLVVLIFIKDYYLYVLAVILSQAVNNVMTAVVTSKMFPRYRPEGKLSGETTKKINRRIRDLFTAKLGAVVLTSADTVVISAFLGLTALAIYQNYYFILSSVLGCMEIIFNAVMAGLGNSFVVETREKNYGDFRKFSFLFLWLTGVCSCCFLGIYQPFMEVWVGQELMLNFTAVICFTVYFFVRLVNRFLSVYKDAAGLWHADRFRPMVTSLLNLVLNLLLVQVWGIYGVLLSTVVSMLFVGMPWILSNVFTKFFTPEQLRGYLKQLLIFVALTVLSGALVCLLCALLPSMPWLRLVLSCLISVAVPNVLFFLLLRASSHFRPAVQLLDRMTKQKLKLEKRLCRDAQS